MLVSNNKISKNLYFLEILWKSKENNAGMTRQKYTIVK